MRENVRSSSLVVEVQAYQQLLRRHGFLRYSSDGREYDVRRKVAIDGIAEALQQTTGVGLPVIHEEVQLEDLREVTIQSIQRLMRQTIRNMKLTLRTFELHSPIARYYGEAIHQWEKAMHALGAYALRARVRTGGKAAVDT